MGGNELAICYMKMKIKELRANKLGEATNNFVCTLHQPIQSQI
jgi:hypothetical protein